MAEQKPEERIHNSNEVPYGFTPEQAQQEAARCLQCKNAPCMKGCPVEVDIPAFIQLIKDGDFSGAARKLKETNSLPAICGRVCHHPCESVCTRGQVDEPVAIDFIKRFVADLDLNSETRYLPRSKTKERKRSPSSAPALLDFPAPIIWLRRATGSPSMKSSL